MRPISAVAWLLVLLVAIGQMGALAAATSDPGGTAIDVDPSSGSVGSIDTYEGTGIGGPDGDSGEQTSWDDSLDVGGLQSVGDAIAAVESAPGGPVLVIAGYSRYASPEPLGHDLRADIHAVVTGSPGASRAEVVDRTGANESTVRYHGKVLVQEGLLQRATIWGALRYYPSDVDADDFELVAALQDETLAGVVAAVARHEPATGMAIADELDRAPSTVSHHLSRLAEAGLVDRERDGEAVLTSLSPDVRAALDAGATSPHGSTATAVLSDD